jgi:Zn-dependent alcohol dehydrogenase
MVVRILGLSAVQGAAIAGADPVVAVDVSEAKLAVAVWLGATRCVNAAERDPVAVIAEANRRARRRRCDRGRRRDRGTRAGDGRNETRLSIVATRSAA